MLRRRRRGELDAPLAVPDVLDHVPDEIPLVDAGGPHRSRRRRGPVDDVPRAVADRVEDAVMLDGEEVTGREEDEVGHLGRLEKLVTGKRLEGLGCPRGPVPAPDVRAIAGWALSAGPEVAEVGTDDRVDGDVPIERALANQVH